MRLLPSTCMACTPFFSWRALSTFFSTLSSMVCICCWLMVAPLFGFSRAPLHGSLCSHGSSLADAGLALRLFSVRLDAATTGSLPCAGASLLRVSREVSTSPWASW